MSGGDAVRGSGLVRGSGPATGFGPPTGVGPPTGFGPPTGVGPVRRVRAYGGFFALVAVLAAVAALLITGVPRAANAAADRALRQDIARLPSDARDLTLSHSPDPRLDGVDLAEAEGLLDGYQRTLPEPLPRLVGERWFSASLGPDNVTSIAPSGPRLNLGLWARTGVEQAVRITTGRWSASPADGQPEIVVSDRVAEKLGLRVGAVLALNGGPLAVRVVGTFQPVDAAGRIWDDLPLALDTPWPGPEQPFQAVALTDRAGLLTTATATNLISYSWRYRIDERRLHAGLLDSAVAAVSEVRRAPPPRPRSSVLALESRVRAATGLDAALDTFRQQVRSARGLLTVVQAGLLATLLGLVALAAGLTIARRREELALLRARGAAARTVGARTLAESLLVVPVAVLAGTLLGTLAPGRAAGTGWYVLAAGAVITLTTPVLAAARHGGVTFTARRPDLVGRRPSGRRLVAELLLLVLAGLGCYLLRRRGLTSATDSGAVDPYLAAVPVLAAAAAAVLLLRLLPGPLRVLGRLAARGAGAVPFLGLAGASRAASASTGAVAVLVTAIATGVFSGAVTTTVDRARDAAAEREIPADLRLAGSDLPVDTARRLAEVPGVTAVTQAVFEFGVPVRSAAATSVPAVSVLVLEPATFARVAEASGVGVEFPAALAGVRGPDGRAAPVPAVVSPDVADDLAGTAGRAGLRGRTYEFTAAAVAERFPGLEDTVDRFVVLPWPALPVHPATPLTANRFFLAGPGADPSAVLAAAEQARRDAPAVPGRAVDPVAGRLEVTTRAALRDALDRTGANDVLTVTYTVGTVGGAVLGLLAVAFAVLAGARARGRALSRLRTMGLSARQGRGLLVYELVPLLTVAVLAGGLVGVGLPGLLGPALGLAAFTAGGPATVRLDPLVVAGLLGAALAGLALAVAIENPINRRLRLAEVLRLGDGT